MTLVEKLAVGAAAAAVAVVIAFVAVWWVGQVVQEIQYRRDLRDEPRPVARPKVQYREPIQVRRVRVSHASPETATGSPAYPGRHRRTGAPTPREAALTTRTQAMFVRALEQAGETPPATFGPREPVHTRTYTPPAWEQPPLRGMPPIVKEVTAL